MPFLSANVRPKALAASGFAPGAAFGFQAALPQHFPQHFVPSQHRIPPV